MIRADMIPDEVVEAAARAAWRLKDQRLWEVLKATQPKWRDEARASIAAALNAWPGSEYVYRQPHRRAVSYSSPAIILPLPQEASDE